jgi:hypothetical protein
MLLLEEDLKTYGKQMLNVRHRKKEIKEIACTMYKTFSRAKAAEGEFNQPKTTVTKPASSFDDFGDSPF